MPSSSTSPTANGAGRAGPSAAGRRRLHDERQQGDQGRDGRQGDQELLRTLGAQMRHEEQAEAQRAGDRAHGVRGVNASHQPARILSRRGGRGQGQGEAGSPQTRGRQNGPHGAHHVELEHHPGAALRIVAHRNARDRRANRESSWRPCRPSRRWRRPAAVWQTPRRKRGETTAPRNKAPTLLPIPSPTRNTARMIENVYTVPPNSSERVRVQTTSAPGRTGPTARSPGRSTRPGPLLTPGPPLPRLRATGGVAAARRARSAPPHVDRHGDQRRDSHVVHAEQVTPAASSQPTAPAMLPPYRISPAHDTPWGVVSTQRAIAGSVAPIRIVGGSRQMALTTPRRKMPDEPCQSSCRRSRSRQSRPRSPARVARCPAPTPRTRAAGGARGDDSRQQQAAQAHAAHERPQQHAQRDGRRADQQLQQLQPHDFVNQRRAAAADEQQEQHGQKPAVRIGLDASAVVGAACSSPLLMNSICVHPTLAGMMSGLGMSRIPHYTLTSLRVAQAGVLP